LKASVDVLKGGVGVLKGGVGVLKSRVGVLKESKFENFNNTLQKRFNKY
jgi:hypothetical protein